MAKKTQAHEAIEATELCPLWKVLSILGILVLGSLTWLSLEVHGAAIERAVVRTKLEGMAEDVKTIKDMLRHAINEEKSK